MTGVNSKVCLIQTLMFTQKSLYPRSTQVKRNQLLMTDPLLKLFFFHVRSNQKQENAFPFLSVAVQPIMQYTSWN
uniref:Uncharacterized protein n=1 Tax=Anguilla anguilla TaxID=7936 RepID=A0A0E9X0F5_ANGAN